MCNCFVLSVFARFDIFSRSLLGFSLSFFLVSNECKWHRFSVVSSSSFMWSKASSMIHLNVNKMLEKFCSEFSFYLLFKFQAVCYVAMRKAFYLSWIALHVGIEAKTTAEKKYIFKFRLRCDEIMVTMERLSSCRRRLETLITQSNNRTRNRRRIRTLDSIRTHTQLHMHAKVFAALAALSIKCLFPLHDCDE